MTPGPTPCISWATSTTRTCEYWPDLGTNVRRGVAGALCRCLLDHGACARARCPQGGCTFCVEAHPCWSERGVRWKRGGLACIYGGGERCQIAAGCSLTLTSLLCHVAVHRATRSCRLCFDCCSFCGSASSRRCGRRCRRMLGARPYSLSWLPWRRRRVRSSWISYLPPTLASSSARWLPSAALPSRKRLKVRRCDESASTPEEAVECTGMREVIASVRLSSCKAVKPHVPQHYHGRSITQQKGSGQGK